MKSIRIASIALALIAAAALTGTTLFASDGIEVLCDQPQPIDDGIEVLGIEVLDSGATYCVTRVHNVPAGSYVTAEMSPNGDETILVDAAPINPSTGETTLVFPLDIPGNRITVHTPDGIVYSVGYEGQLEYD